MYLERKMWTVGKTGMFGKKGSNNVKRKYIIIEANSKLQSDKKIMNCFHCHLVEETCLHHIQIQEKKQKILLLKGGATASSNSQDKTIFNAECIMHHSVYFE